MQAILSLLDDPAERRRLAENGKRRLACDYSRGDVRRQLFETVATFETATAAEPVELPAGAAVARLAHE